MRFFGFGVRKRREGRTNSVQQSALSFSLSGYYRNDQKSKVMSSQRIWGLTL